VANGVDLRPLLAAVGHRPDSTPIEEVIGPRKTAQLARLRQAGLANLGDARSLCPKTASYCDEPVAGLADQVDAARAALGDAPAYRRRGVGPVSVPRGDIEVDIDMENVEDGVYLWGVLVTDRSGKGLVPAGYRAFVTWGPLAPDEEAALFLEFWHWLTQLRAVAAGSGLRLRAYCYNEAAEDGQMRRLGGTVGLRAEVETLIGSEEWVDLRRVFEDQLVTGSSVGLKHVAPLSGFRWEVDDPGGDVSMLYYETAVGTSEVGAAAARTWLLTYNRNDVEATAALRQWLDAERVGVPVNREPGALSRVGFAAFDIPLGRGPKEGPRRGRTAMLSAHHKTGPLRDVLTFRAPVHGRPEATLGGGGPPPLTPALLGIDSLDRRSKRRLCRRSRTWSDGRDRHSAPRPSNHSLSVRSSRVTP
jgi:hypothetical protein